VRCGEFDAKVDRYIDGVLSPVEMADASRHADECTACTQTVAQYQQVRVLLTTAVTEKVAAVDVSGLWEAIDARLDVPLTSVPASWTDIARSWLAGAVSTARSFGSVLGDVAPHRAGWVAAAAGVAVVIALGMSGRDPGPNVSPPSRVASRGVRIDSMEVGAGHSVSTWMRPRTGTRVIWVADATGAAESSGFGVTNVRDDR